MMAARGGSSRTTAKRKASARTAKRPVHIAEPPKASPRSESLYSRASRYYDQARDTARSSMNAVRDAVDSVSGRDVVRGLKKATRME